MPETCCTSSRIELKSIPQLDQQQVCMIPRQSSEMNFYYRLGVPETASFDDIRKAYYRKMLTIHPDRSSGNNTESSQEITAAWEILRDEAKRSEYDTKIKINNAALENHAFYEKVILEDCIVESENEWILECRCGGEYKISKDDIQSGFRYFCCSNCSLKINLIEH